MAFPFPFELPEDGLEPTEVRFTDVRVEPWPDSLRVRALITLTPFLKRPNLYAEIRDAEGTVLCSAHVIETMDARMVFTLHLRSEPSGRRATLDIRLSYEEHGQIDQRLVEFSLDAAA